MSVDDGSADGQPHPRAIDLRGVKRLENALEMLGIDARAGITHRHQESIWLGLLRADQQLPLAGLNGAHRFNRVQDCASRQPHHFIDRLVEIKPLLSWRFFDVVMDLVNNLSGPIGIADDTTERSWDVG
jgi:hypothetical protein